MNKTEAFYEFLSNTTEITLLTLSRGWVGPVFRGIYKCYSPEYVTMRDIDIQLTAPVDVLCDVRLTERGRDIAALVRLERGL